MNNRNYTYLTQKQALQKNNARQKHFEVESGSSRPIKDSPENLLQLLEAKIITVVNRDEYIAICQKASNFPDDPLARDIPVNEKKDPKKRKLDQVADQSSASPTKKRKILPKTTVLQPAIVSQISNNVNFNNAAPSVQLGIYAQINFLNQPENIAYINQAAASQPSLAITMQNPLYSSSENIENFFRNYAASIRSQQQLAIEIPVLNAQHYSYQMVNESNHAVHSNNNEIDTLDGQDSIANNDQQHFQAGEINSENAPHHYTSDIFTSAFQSNNDAADDQLVISFDAMELTPNLLEGYTQVCSSALDNYIRDELDEYEQYLLNIGDTLPESRSPYSAHFFHPSDSKHHTDDDSNELLPPTPGNN